MSKTNEPAAQRAPGNREGFVPRAGIIAFTGGLLLLAAVTLYSLWAFWPLGLEIVPGDPERRRVSYLGLTDFTVSTEGIYFVTVALGGCARRRRPHPPVVLDVRRDAATALELGSVQPAAAGGRSPGRDAVLSRVPGRAVLVLDLDLRCEPIRVRRDRSARGPLLGAGGGEAEADRQASLHGSSQVPARPLRRGDQTRDTHGHVIRCRPWRATPDPTSALRLRPGALAPRLLSRPGRSDPRGRSETRLSALSRGRTA